MTCFEGRPRSKHRKGSSQQKAMGFSNWVSAYCRKEAPTSGVFTDVLYVVGQNVKISSACFNHRACFTLLTANTFKKPLTQDEGTGSGRSPFLGLGLITAPLYSDIILPSNTFCFILRVIWRSLDTLKCFHQLNELNVKLINRDCRAWSRRYMIQFSQPI